MPAAMEWLTLSKESAKRELKIGSKINVSAAFRRQLIVVNDFKVETY